MNSVKHWVDITIAIMVAVATKLAALMTFVTAFLGAVWYAIRIYEWWKGRKNANLRHDHLDS